MITLTTEVIMKNGQKATKKYVNQNNTKSKIDISPILNLTSEQIQEAIRLKAYDLYVQRGCQQGAETEDWLIAERIVLQTEQGVQNP
jgi:hypothetical protein